MTKKPEASPQKAASAAAKPVSPESALNARINDLQAQAVKLEQEIKTIHGKLANRDPAQLPAITKENQSLHARVELLEKALLALVQDSFKPRNPEDLNQQYEVLRQATVEYCKKAGIDPELWKSIAS